jgi:hypothetical protein
MLASEAVAFTKTGKSNFEIQWQDPIDAMRDFSEAVWSSSFGAGSGLNVNLRRLL